MFVAPRRTPEKILVTALLAAGLACVDARAADGVPDVLTRAAESTPALQGHDAEAAMRGPEAEARHRRLFFDTATVEEGEAQVSCDHRARRRPDVVGGKAVVAVVFDPATGRVRLRVWRRAEDAAGTMEDLAARTRPGEAVDALAFLACR